MTKKMAINGSKKKKCKMKTTDVLLVKLRGTEVLVSGFQSGGDRRADLSLLLDNS